MLLNDFRFFEDQIVFVPVSEVFVDGHDHPQFIEGAVFKTIIPLDESLTDTLIEKDAVNDTLNSSDKINDALTDTLSDNGAVVDAVNDTLNPAYRINDAVTDKINEAIKQKISNQYKKPVQEKLVKLTLLIYQNSLLKAEELAIIISVSIPTIKRYLKILKNIQCYRATQIT
ncbi:MAG: hypothetical protein M0R39_09150 [Prolixibacteraceae bacterium]|nr:hypothetical protein [Prolixibacteraceae bacterium]